MQFGGPNTIHPSNGTLISKELIKGELAVINFTKSYVRYEITKIKKTIDAILDLKVDTGYVCGSGT